MEKKVILCDICEVQVCNSVCPLCNKDCCKKCFGVTNLSLGNSLISNIEICTNCYYTCKVIPFDKNSITQLMKDFLEDMKNVITTAHLADDNLDSKVKKMKKEEEEKTQVRSPYGFQMPTGLSTTSNYFPAPKRRGLFSRNSLKSAGL